MRQCNNIQTPDSFGKIIRDIRITEGILLYDMARELGLGSAKLSAIECGQTPIPNWFVPKILEHYKSASQYKTILIEAAEQRKEERVM